MPTEGLSEDGIRIHTHTAHVDRNAVCLSELSSESLNQLILHVNQVHLGFLTLGSIKTISFVDNPSPSECSVHSGDDNYWNYQLYSAKNNICGKFA